MNEPINIVFIGDPEAGKSTLIYALSKEGLLRENTRTIGVDFKNREFVLDRNRKIKCRLWDTSGNNRFSVVRTSYYRSAKIICIVTNANLPAIEQIRQIQFYQSEIAEIESNADILVIANQKHLYKSLIKLSLEELENINISPSQYIIVSAHEVAEQILSGYESALEKKLADMIEKIIGPCQKDTPPAEHQAPPPLRKMKKHKMELSTLGGNKDNVALTSPTTTAPPITSNFFSNLFSSSNNINNNKIKMTLDAIKRLTKAQAAIALDIIHLNLKDGPLHNKSKPYHIGVFGLGGTTHGCFKNKNITSATTQEREIHFESKAKYSENGMIWLSMTMPFSSDCLALNMLTQQEIDELDGRLVLSNLYYDVVTYIDKLWDLSIIRHPKTTQFYKDLPKIIEKAILIVSELDIKSQSAERPSQ